MTSEGYHGAENISRASHAVAGVYLITVATVATVGNSFVIVMITSDKKLRSSPNNILLLNLAVADFGVSLLGYPCTTISSFAGRWLFGDIACVIEGFTVTFCCLADINTLVAIGVVRYIYVCKPQYKYIFSQSQNIVMILASTWLYSFAWSIPPVFGWCSYDYEMFGTSCSMKWDGQTASDISYTVLLIIFEYALIIVALAYLYGHVVYKSAKTLKRLEKCSQKCSENVLKTQNLRQENRITIMIVVMVVAFIIIWSPYTWVSLWAIIDINSMTPTLSFLPTLFAKSSCAVNPIIYGLMNKHFRDSVTSKFKIFRNRARVGDQATTIHAKREQARKEKEVFSINATKEGIYIGDQQVELSPTQGTVF